MIRPDPLFYSTPVRILYALDEVPGSVFGALHNSMQGWQAKARMHKFAVDGAKP